MSNCDGSNYITLIFLTQAPIIYLIGYHRYLHGLVVQTLARLHLQGGHEIPGYQLDASSESNICLKLDRLQVVASVNLITSVISRIAPLNAPKTNHLKGPAFQQLFSC